MDEHSLIEFRQYRTEPGRRADFIALFDREFVDSQDAVGSTSSVSSTMKTTRTASPGCGPSPTCEAEPLR